MPSSKKRSPRAKFLLSLRNAIILFLAVVAGVATGFLLFSAGMPAGQAVVGGFAAAGGAVVFFDGIVE